MKYLFQIGATVAALIAISPASAQNADVKTLQNIIAIQKAALDKLEPGPWLDLTFPGTDWKLLNGSVQCRRNGGWIEFKGVVYHPVIKGWPVPPEQVPLLPKDCRPKSLRFTEMACHGVAATRPMVCNNDFYPDGRILIHTDAEAVQQRFEGVRIWSED